MSSPRCFRPAGVDQPLNMLSRMLNALCAVRLATTCHCLGKRIALLGSGIQSPLLQVLHLSDDILQQLFGSAPLDYSVFHPHLADDPHQSCEHLRLHHERKNVGLHSVPPAGLAGAKAALPGGPRKSFCPPFPLASAENPVTSRRWQKSWLPQKTKAPAPGLTTATAPARPDG